jgi:hypothetical protein
VVIGESNFFFILVVILFVLIVYYGCYWHTLLNNMDSRIFSTNFFGFIKYIEGFLSVPINISTYRYLIANNHKSIQKKKLLLLLLTLKMFIPNISLFFTLLKIDKNLLLKK